ncbi:MAG: ECF transporter S component [Streptococcus salivarius]
MSAKRLTLSAFFMALVVILSSSLLSIPVPGGHFYFNGIIIFLVGLIFPPMDAVIIAGVGSFIGDFLLPSSYVGNTSNTQPSSSCYLTCWRWRLGKLSKPRAVLGLLFGAIINLLGYGFGRAFIYGTPAYANDENSF